ncbi:hypothetical protein KIH87_11170 [Paraneptunicella aestuarii]|uniref:hypothetical protein n=1 Tax=Paraneptunicella aestuarii TaxID=2831148 RepID=UPI001E367086|nr:hypothetical protein [Paraneptunicella aestuarii]UAA37292.1 hypothetical protein KIH87_11170 [Paraneptunicella aestuarii]
MKLLNKIKSPLFVTVFASSLFALPEAAAEDNWLDSFKFKVISIYKEGGVIVPQSGSKQPDPNSDDTNG